MKKLRVTGPDWLTFELEIRRRLVFVWLLLLLGMEKKRDMRKTSQRRGSILHIHILHEEDQFDELPVWTDCIQELPGIDPWLMQVSASAVLQIAAQHVFLSPPCRAIIIVFDILYFFMTS
ncbi:hypothetical protein F2P81_002651 [Scophthalmus maximus]|uniref:Uncharacterized protein n=1 Tax=Scophthalmus maximus TaxID=52904 RepID=A0A6A4TVP8_SCOMX|nr:hypothetical protein F2P81_002651 [Scophthalmus maximus]